MTASLWGAPAVNHVEMVHRPGERELAAQVLGLLGCSVIDQGGTWVSAFPDGPRTDSNNVLYVSEVTPEQWELELQLASLFGAGSPLNDAWEGFQRRMRKDPQRSTHFGLRCVDREAFDRRLAAVREAEVTAALKNRLRLVDVFYPGEVRAVSDTLAQAFVWTDVVASGSLSMGQHIEIQWRVAS